MEIFDETQRSGVQETLPNAAVGGGRQCAGVHGYTRSAGDRCPGTHLGFFGFSVMVYGLWLLGWHSSVRIRADELVVDNLAKRYRVPWEAFAEFAVEEGLEVRLKNRSVIGSIAFGGSLIGSLLGYGHTNRVCQKMDAARLNMTKTRSGEDLPDGHRKVRTEAYFPRIPLAFVVAYFWIIATISFFVGP